MRHQPLFLLCAFLACLSLGCSGAILVDCEALTRDNAECMDAQAQAECAASNDDCEDRGGEVLQLESCPVQFACSAND